MNHRFTQLVTVEDLESDPPTCGLFPKGPSHGVLSDHHQDHLEQTLQVAKFRFKACSPSFQLSEIERFLFCIGGSGATPEIRGGSVDDAYREVGIEQMYGCQRFETLFQHHTLLPGMRTILMACNDRKWGISFVFH